MGKGGGERRAYTCKKGRKQFHSQDPIRAIFILQAVVVKAVGTG